MYKKFTQETVLELLEKGMLEVGQYVLTDHYLVVTGKLISKAYEYLYDNCYCSTMDSQFYTGGKEEFGVIYINR